jgi:hypothetical protein
MCLLTVSHVCTSQTCVIISPCITPNHFSMFVISVYDTGHGSSKILGVSTFFTSSSWAVLWNWKYGKTLTGVPAGISSHTSFLERTQPYSSCQHVQSGLRILPSRQISPSGSGPSHGLSGALESKIPQKRNPFLAQEI